MPRSDAPSNILNYVKVVALRIGRVPLFIISIWLFTVWWGEHATFAGHIRECLWQNWEGWVSLTAVH